MLSEFEQNLIKETAEAATSAGPTTIATNNHQHHAKPKKWSIFRQPTLQTIQVSWYTFPRFVTLGSKSSVFLGRMASVCQVLLRFALSVSGSIFGKGRELMQIYSTSEGVFGSISPTNTPLRDRSDKGATYLGWVLCIECFRF